MTLFDRKVDLARFTHSTPLYVMCREWMCNNPEKLSSIKQNSTLLNDIRPSEGSGVSVSTLKSMLYHYTKR